MFPRNDMNKKIKKTIIILTVGVILIALFEAAFSNRVSIALKLGDYEEAEFHLGEYDYSGKITSSGTSLLFDGAGSVTLYPDMKVYNVRLDSTGPGYVTVTSYITDENTTDTLYKAGKSYVNAKDISVGLKSAGVAKAIKLDFDSDAARLNVSRIRINSAEGFSFNLLRFALLTIVFAAAVVFWLLGYNERVFSASKSKLLIAVASLLCLPQLLLGSVKEMDFDPYPFRKSVNEYTCYQQQADAFLKGRLDLDVDFDTEELEKLENPYDYYERRSEVPGYEFIWDRAYYNGRFYSYFGVVPVLLCYVPICLITGYMPGDGVVSALLTAYAIAAMICALIGMAKYFKLKTSTTSFFLAIPTLCTASLVYVLNVHPSMYYSAVISGITFLALTLFFSFMAGSEERTVRRRVYLALAGVSAVLVVGSRPGLIVFVLMLLPLYLRLFFGEKRRVKSKSFDLVSVASPVLAGAAAIMWYNAARFSSPLDFGSSYQITFADMSYQGIEFFKFFPAIYHYFIQPPAFTGCFPYVDIASNDLGLYRGYHYIFGSVGALSFPVTWGVFGSGAASKGDKLKKYTLICGIAAAVIIAFTDFCMAGVHIRYMGDIMFPLALIGIFVLLDLVGKAMDTPYAAVVRRICTFIFVCSFFVGFALLFANEADNIRKLSPKTYHIIEMLFE